MKEEDEKEEKKAQETKASVQTAKACLPDGTKLVHRRARVDSTLLTEQDEQNPKLPCANFRSVRGFHTTFSALTLQPPSLFALPVVSISFVRVANLGTHLSHGGRERTSGCLSHP